MIDLYYQNVYYVTAGVVIGHGMCTALAVIGGRMLASKISVRTGKKRQKKGEGAKGHVVLFIYGILNICVLVTFAGAILFLIFGVFYSVNAYNGLQE